jgi:AcrR family transcriptional regulator
MVAEPTLPDRRQRRRQQTIEEALDVAVDVMAEQGVAGLSVGEVARRMGIRPPSLYVYFASKNALYDAIFARGWRLICDAMAPVYERLAAMSELPPMLLTAGRFFVGWALEHPAYAQLMLWRPVPGFQPTPEAYELAVAVVETGRAAFADMQRRGLFRADVAVEDIHRDWTVLISGVTSQQLANEPTAGLDDGRFTAALPRLVDMFSAHYAPATTTARAPRRGRNARTR